MQTIECRHYWSFQRVKNNILFINFHHPPLQLHYALGSVAHTVTVVEGKRHTSVKGACSFATTQRKLSS